MNRKHNTSSPSAGTHYSPAICPLCGEEIQVETSENVTICPHCDMVIDAGTAQTLFLEKYASSDKGQPIQLTHEDVLDDLEDRSAQRAAVATARKEKKRKNRKIAGGAVLGLAALAVAGVCIAGSRSATQTRPQNKPEDTYTQAEPTVEPTAVPSPTPAPTAEPTPVPTVEPTPKPSATPKATIAVPSGTQQMTLQFEASCAEYNSVGNEWSCKVTVDGEEALSGSTIRVKAGASVTIEAEVTEYDESSPDVGTDSFTHEFTAEELADGYSETRSVSVQEDHGRYSGRTCTWTIEYSFMP